MTEQESGERPKAATRRAQLHEVAEDATGFGLGELRMSRDLILRPHKVVVEQAQPGSSYPKPLRYYLALNGLYMVLIAVLGGFEGALDPMIDQLLQGAVAASGKSADAFRADLDQWYSLVVVPVLAMSLYLPLRLLFARWSGSPRPDGQAFTFLSAWTLAAAPIGLLGLVAPQLSWLTLAAWGPILLVLFWRMGRDVWWRTTGQYVRRVLVMGAALFLTQTVASLVVFAVAVAGAVFGP